jgi:outer membrane protein OmpA-like peptidoglycan-associated protein
MRVKLLFLLLSSGGLAFAATDDDPLPQGTQFRVLDISLRVATIDPKVVDLAEGKAAHVAPTLNELANKAFGINTRETAQSIVIELSSDILFDFDRADLRPGAEQSLRKIAEFIAARDKRDVLIEGYTDSKGSDDYNGKLSLARAESVHRWLVRNGRLESATISTAGRGASNPVAPNTQPDGRDDPVGRQKNRRVEITIKKNPR